MRGPLDEICFSLAVTLFRQVASPQCAIYRPEVVGRAVRSVPNDRLVPINCSSNFNMVHTIYITIPILIISKSPLDGNQRHGPLGDTLVVQNTTLINMDHSFLC